MFKVPPAVVPLLQFLYGEDKWWRIWAMILTGIAVFLIPRATRRLASFAFITLFCSMFIWNWLQTAYHQFTPDEKDYKPVKKSTRHYL